MIYANALNHALYMTRDFPFCVNMMKTKDKNLTITVHRLVENLLTIV